MVVTPSVTVVIPCFNGSMFLHETLESVLAQTHPPLEVIVVDDGSTDDSAAIAESFGPPVRVIRQRNQGESVARNRGMEEAQGEWIALLDADDLWEPEKLAKQLSLAADDVACVHSNVYLFGRVQKVRDFRDVPEDERYTIRTLATRGTLNSSNIMVRAALGLRYVTWTQHAEDMIFGIEIARRGRIRLIPEPLVGYRLHPGGQSAPFSRAADRHNTMREWCRRNADWLSAEERSYIEEHWLNSVLRRFELAQWSRKWDDFEKLRQHLVQFEDVPRVRDALAKRVYPRWIYRVKDAVDRRLKRNGTLKASVAELEA